MTDNLPAADALAACLERVREAAPHIHCLTNTVAENFTANVLLALGAVPTMSLAPAEARHFTGRAKGLLVNLGTLNPAIEAGIGAALPVVEAEGKPWVLDPAFVDLSPPRLALANDLVARKPTVVRCNLKELAALGGSDPVRFAGEAGVAVAVSGAVDRAAFRGREVRIANGTPMLARITATGCALGAVVAAFLAVDDDPLVAAVGAMATFAIAGERAAAKSAGPGSLAVHLLDALYTLSPDDLLSHARLS